MKSFLASLCYVFPAIIAMILVLLTPIPSAQLTNENTNILLQVQMLLEYPQVLQEWTNVTNFCDLTPSNSLKILCTDSHVTELTIIGNTSSSLSERFSIESLFTFLTRLSNMKVLSLVSLGLWGPLPSKISRLRSLEVLNLTSNFVYGKIPSSISSMKNLRSLVLAYNMFNGNVPNLKKLVSLQELNLCCNKLGPEFPSVDNNLVNIVLRNNSLRCEIPPKLMNANKLELFDISSNEIFGNIPLFLFSFPFLENLNLSSNQLSGSFSENISCSSSLTFVDISSNFVVGNLPPCFVSDSSNRTILYSGNCLSTTSNFSQQYPSSHCNTAALDLDAKVKVENRKESKMLLGLGIGIIGGVLASSGVFVLLILSYLGKFKAQRADSGSDGSVDDTISVLACARPNVNAWDVPLLMRQSELWLPPYTIFTLKEIEDATNNFDPSNLIGEGSQGKLYKGSLIDGSIVMVSSVKLKKKNLYNISVQNLKVLPNLRHRHLVSVLGHCIVTNPYRPKMGTRIFIVFESISNMSLRVCLADRRKKELLKWQQRMAIIIGIARGINFLHTGVSPGIYGNNIKIENILLDISLNPKLSGYRIPLQSKKDFDTEYNEQNVQNHVDSINDEEKEDIYQLGVILLEVITGKIITSSSEVDELKYELERGLSEAALPTIPLRGVIEPSFEGTYHYESLKTAVQMTINCLDKVPRNRPSIEDILWNLQYSMQVQEARTERSSSKASI